MPPDELLESLFPLGFSVDVYEADRASNMWSHMSTDLLRFLCKIKWNGLSMLLFIFFLGGGNQLISVQLFSWKKLAIFQNLLNHGCFFFKESESSTLFDFKLQSQNILQISKCFPCILIWKLWTHFLTFLYFPQKSISSWIKNRAFLRRITVIL